MGLWKGIMTLWHNRAAFHLVAAITIGAVRHIRWLLRRG